MPVMADLTPAELLAATAADMREVAGAATFAPWLARPRIMFGGYQDGDSIEATGGVDVADRAAAEDASHIAAWDPEMARAVADWLDAEARAYGRYRLAGQQKIIDIGPCGPLKLAICHAWWASRGMAPKAVDHA
jgi:hypothetical protein